MKKNYRALVEEILISAKIPANIMRMSDEDLEENFELLRLEMERRSLLENLETGIVKIMYIRKDGTINAVRATHLSEYTAPCVVDKDSLLDLIPYWDMDNDCWGSFYFNRVISWEAIPHRDCSIED